MAKLSQLWKAVGITNHSNLGAKDTIRWGADFVNIVKRFSKDAVRCDYVELPEPMDKASALAFLAAHPDFQSPGDQATIAEKQEKYAPKPQKKVRVPKDKAVTSFDTLWKSARRSNNIDVMDILNAIGK